MKGSREDRARDRNFQSRPLWPLPEGQFYRQWTTHKKQNTTKRNENHPGFGICVNKFDSAFLEEKQRDFAKHCGLNALGPTN